MKRMSIVVVVVVVMLAMASVVLAGDRFGVPVYPGATYDAATSKALKESMGFNGECYQTNDPVAKVAEFYRAKGLELLGDVTRDAAMFRQGKVDVTIQNPWMDMRTGALKKNTLISIVKRDE